MSKEKEKIEEEQSKKGKQVEIVLSDKDGDPYAYIKGITNLETLRKQDGFFTHLVESSSRTADSSKYYDLIDAIKMQDFLLNKVWGYKKNIETKTLTTHIYTIRKKIIPFKDILSVESSEDGYYLK